MLIFLPNCKFASPLHLCQDALGSDALGRNNYSGATGADPARCRRL